MDPVSLISLAASVVGISHVITKSLASLVSLQSKYTGANLTISLLIGQLTILKAALNQIATWTTSASVDATHQDQVVKDLKISLEGCNLLISLLEERISQLDTDSSGALNVKGRVRFLWKEQGLNEFTTHLNNQVNALNLLLTALNCRTAIQTNQLLQDRESRRIIKRVEDDRSSLLQLTKDSGSLRTGSSSTIEGLNPLDTDFGFDREIFRSRVYRAALVSNLKKATANDKSLKEVIPELRGGKVEVDLALGRRKPGLDLGLHHPVTSSNQDDEKLTQDLIGLALSTEADDADTIKETASTGASKPFPQIPEPVPMAHQTGFNRWLQTDGVVLQTIEMNRSSTRSSRVESLLGQSDRDSIYWHEPERPLNETQGGDEEPLHDSAKSKTKRSARLKKDKKLASIFPASKLLGSLWRSPDPVAKTTSWNEKDFTQLSPQPEKASTVLLLGSGNSGKTTLFKVMKRVCEGRIALKERQYLRGTIINNLVTNMQLILTAMENLEMEVSSAYLDYLIVDFWHRRSASDLTHLSRDLSDVIEKLWADPQVQKCYSRRREYNLPDDAAYLFNSLDRISQPSYLPTEEDALRIRIRSTGLHSTTLQYGHLNLKFIDTGGERAERKKWIHCFIEDVPVIFVVDGSAWDCFLYEDENVNRTQEDLTLFESIINSERTINSRVILLFTKVDLLQGKIRDTNITDSFPDFEGDQRDFNTVKEYITNRFVSLNRNTQRGFTTAWVNLVDGHEAAEMVLRMLQYVLTSEIGGSTWDFNKIEAASTADMTMRITKYFEEAGL